LNLKCDLLVSKFAFKWVNLYHYAEGKKGNLRGGPADSLFADRVFTNAINTAIETAGENFETMMFREAGGCVQVGEFR
jgi:hypothetical protein